MKYFHLQLLGFIFIFTSCATFKSREAASVGRPPQFVLLAFDGSKSLSMWQETRAFARANRIKFTYFVSGVYFIPNNSRDHYAEPRRGLGRSAIGWGNSPQEVNQRYAQVIAAINEGHEIASHANGHYDGASYTPMEWSMELRQFRDIVKNGWELVGRQRPASWWNRYFDEEVIGFRAPQLGYNQSMLRALAVNGYAYDTSRSGQMSYWPEKINNVWNFPLAGLRIAGTGARTLSMDYNFYVADSNAQRAPENRWQVFEDRMYETYMNYFNNNYYGNRAPIDIGHHFSKWNGGAYWNAMKRFARQVCNQPEVRCVTYSDLVRFLEGQRFSTLEKYRNAEFAKLEPDSKVKRGLANTSSEELSDEELEELIRNLPPIPHDDDEVNGD